VGGDDRGEDDQREEREDDQDRDRERPLTLAPRKQRGVRRVAGLQGAAALRTRERLRELVAWW
jgi:hypothetical protein